MNFAENEKESLHQSLCLLYKNNSRGSCRSFIKLKKESRHQLSRGQTSLHLFEKEQNLIKIRASI